MYSVQYIVHKMIKTATSEVCGERLSRERILNAALALVKKDGPSALSMRRLAQELDVWPMSLYRYFRDKDELLAALADAAAESIASPGGNGSWRDQLSELLTQARATLERHPGGLRPDADRPAAVRVRDAGLEILQRAGLQGSDAENAWGALIVYTAGAAAMESTAETFEYGLDRLFDGLSATAPRV